MKQLFLPLAVTMAVVLSCTATQPAPQVQSDFALGADIGWVTEMENNGAHFYDNQGQETDLFALLKLFGINAIRLRVWVDPAEHGNYCNKYDLLNKARRTVDNDMDLMVDFHYSDWWADPGQQNIPRAWTNYSYEEMCDAVAKHTEEVLSLLRENNITPRWVQVGNETSNGMLWEMGRAQTHPEQYAGLFRAGYDAAKRVFPETLVLVHLDNGYAPDLYDWNLGALHDGGAKWDIIGMSLYPFWAHEADSTLTADKIIPACMDNMRRLAAKYDCDVMLVETGMECANDQGQLLPDSALQAGRECMSRIIRECRDSTDNRCRGVFYWEPECKPSFYRLGAFTEDGHPTAIMEAFSDYAQQEATEEKEALPKTK